MKDKTVYILALIGGLILLLVVIASVYDTGFKAGTKAQYLKWEVEADAWLKARFWDCKVNKNVTAEPLGNAGRLI